MKKLFFIICMGIVFDAMAQNKENIQIPFTSTPPVLDGIIDDLWNMVPAVTIDKTFQSEVPTLEAYWKALWDNSALYVLVSVNDDDHWPSWVSGGSWFLFDQPELYLDVNDSLMDGVGPGAKSNGHYQVVMSFASAGANVITPMVASNYRPGGNYCYSLVDEGYIVEYALDYLTFSNKAGSPLSAAAFDALDSIGFDVCIIDQDEGITTTRQRAVWQNTGAKDENYNNMDDAGSITLVNALPQGLNSPAHSAISVYPNPVGSHIIVNADFDMLIFSNMLGITVKTVETSEKNINIETLPTGVYSMQLFKMGKSVGYARVFKN
ncbi:MAG: sugar-binding protein [Bacteroidales bacterium]